MNAHKFVAEEGIDEAKRVLEGAPKWSTHFDGYLYSDKNFHSRCVSLEELKQVVESVEIVEHVGGIECANQILESAPNSWCFACADLRKKEVVRNAPSHNDFVYIADLEKAIADYELVESFKKSTLVEYLDECEQIVNSWPKWKKESMQNAFGFGGKNKKCEVLDMVDISPNCEVRNG